MMRYFYRTCLWFVQFELAIARSAPWQNSAHIATLTADLWHWKRLLDLEEIQHGNYR